MIDVSVIIPTYNRSKRLLKALASVARQRDLPAEVIVVDDGSSDETRQDVVLFKEAHPLNLRYHFQANKGPAAARNSGIRMARGSCLAFLDSDDEWHRDKLTVQYEALRTNPDYLVSHTMERWFRNGEHLNQKKHHLPRHGDIFTHALRLCCVGMSTVMARQELFQRHGVFNEALRCCEDYEYWLRVGAFEKFYLVEKRLTVKHGGRPDQVSNLFRVGMDRFRIQALAELLGVSSLKRHQRAALRKELERRCTIYARGCSRHGKEEEAWFYYQLAEFCRTQFCSS